MLCTAMVPEFLQRRKKLVAGETADTALLTDMRENYRQFRQVLEEITMAATELQANVAGSLPFNPSVVSFQRMHCMALSVGIMLNAVLSSLDVDDMHLLEIESHEYAQTIMSMAHSIAQTKPIGSASLQLFANVAWVGTSDVLLKQNIERVMEEMHAANVTGNFPQMSRKELWDMDSHFRLLDSSLS
jgi:hypothetical protein